jgi:hypothetical protein
VLLHRVKLAADHGRLWPVRELRVTGDVVTVSVGVGDDELIAVARMAGQPLGDELVDGVVQRELRRIGCGAGIE